MATRQIDIFDTILRDGEQADHKMPPEVKLAIAHKLDELGVDIIEAGFPISSDGDAFSVDCIAREVRRPTICALARVLDADIDVAAKALEHAEHPRIHAFIATSDIHVQEKLRMSKETVLDLITNAVLRAKKYCSDVEFSPEDAGRTSPDFLASAVQAAIEAGATVINIPDTVGFHVPRSSNCIGKEVFAFDDLIKYVYKKVPRLYDVKVSVHCHNDLGLAVCNSLLGILAGASQVEGCFLGIGERAGNADLEQIVMALSVRKEAFGCYTNINTELIGPTCRFISEQIGYPIPAHQPIIGSAAFAHSSGVHADGVMKDPRTYEIMNPESVGWTGKSMQLVSHLGRGALAERLTTIGYDGQALVEEVYPRFTGLADRKTKLTDEDLHMLVQELRIKKEIAREKLYSIEDDEIQYGPGIGSVKVHKNGTTIQKAGFGDGPMDALFSAIREAVVESGEKLEGLELANYTVVKGHGGPEAIAWVIVSLRMGGRDGYGRSGNPDTVKASAQAYIRALNNLLSVPVSSSGV